MVQCTNHRVVLISSEEIYESKYGYGRVIANKCVWKCFCCNLITEITFKEEKAKS
jgi:hypothetical protein